MLILFSLYNQSMRFKKIFLCFLVAISFGSFLFPLSANADGIYKIQKFEDRNDNGVFDPDPKKNPGEKAVENGEQSVCYEGFVPCGKTLKLAESLEDGKCPKSSALMKSPVECQLCHFFIMIDNAVDYVVIRIVPLLALLMLVVAGVMFYLGGMKPELVSRAKTVIKGVIIGFALIYGAYIIVNIFLIVLGAASINTIKEVFHDGVFSIKCPVYAPTPSF